jgi:D-sedoheptulose 7-phosphate isomerase
MHDRWCGEDGVIPERAIDPGDCAMRGPGEVDATRVATDYFTEIAELARKADMAAVGEFARTVVDTILQRRALLVAGNGGSASTAGHVVCDLIGSCMSVGIPARIIGIGDNSAVVTALANDIGFEDVFSRQVRLFGGPGDLLLLFSVSGESPNLLNAAREAQACGLRVAVAVGRTNASLLKYADVAVCLDTTDYGLAEDFQLTLNHIVIRLLNGGSPQRCRDWPAMP